MSSSPAPKSPPEDEIEDVIESSSGAAGGNEQAQRRRDEERDLKIDEDDDEEQEGADEDDEDDDDDDDEDEDDEDDGEDEDAEGHRRGKKRRRRAGANRYLDVEAVVDDDEEEYDDEDAELLKEGAFIIPSVLFPLNVVADVAINTQQMASSSKISDRIMKRPIAALLPTTSVWICNEGKRKNSMPRTLQHGSTSATSHEVASRPSRTSSMSHSACLCPV